MLDRPTDRPRNLREYGCSTPLIDLYKFMDALHCSFGCPGYYINLHCIAYTDLPKILLTHPFDTCNMRDISHGLAPECANSTIFCLVESGRGRPPTNTPPN